VLLEDQLHQVSGGLVRRAPWCSAVIDKPGVSTLLVALEPLVPGDAADAVAQAQLAHRPVAANGIVNGRGSLQHGGGLPPWHRASSPEGEGTVNHVPGHL